MFASLIRRKSASPVNADEAIFESTTFSLTTAVPRPAEIRSDDSSVPLLRVAKLVHSSGSQLIRVRNVSAGGLMAEIPNPPEVGEPVSLELSSQKIPSTIVWTREGMVGVKFDQSVDLGELLAGRKPRHGFRPRPPRLEVACKASVRVGKTVQVIVESLRPIKGEVRWYSERKAGIVFQQPLDFDELAEWVGKRLEVASLKASFPPRPGV